MTRMKRCLILFLSVAAVAAGAFRANVAEEPPRSGKLVVIKAEAIPTSLGAVQALTPVDPATIYHNEVSPFRGGGVPPMALEDLTLGPGPVPFPPMRITEIEFGFEVTAATDLKVEIRFWDDFDALANPVNSNLIGGAAYDFGTLAVGAYVTPSLSLPVPLIPGDADIAIQFDFRDSATDALTTAAILFAGGGVTVGASPDRFYPDLNGDGMFDSLEARFFGGAPFLANFFLHLRGAPPPTVIDPGIDLLTTPPGGATQQDFSATPIPSGFFDPGSDPFGGSIIFEGVPLDSTPPGSVFPADTIVRRGGPASLPLPGSSDTIPIEIVALSLVSSNPITVTYSSGSPELWNVRACLSKAPQQMGQMRITASDCAGEGGTFQAILPVLPKLIFRRASDGVIRVLDFGALGAPPIQFQTVNGHWLDYDPGLQLIQSAPGITVDHDCDAGSAEVGPLPGTSNFFPGVRIARCGPGCGGFSRPAKRLTEEQAMLASHGVLPAQQPQPDFDSDGFGNDADNCPGIPNPRQGDFDDDTVGNACDNCPGICNVDQLDADADAAGDVCDCAPANAGAKEAPAEVEALGVVLGVPGPGDVTVFWNSQDLTAGPDTNYDVARGRLSLVFGPGGYPGGAVCGQDDAPDTPYTESFLVCPAPPGDGCWYEVRGQNVCGTGTYGQGTFGDSLDPFSPCP